MLPGHRAFRYNLTSASTGNEDLGEMCLHGTGIRSQQYRSFYDRESRFAIYDNPDAESQSKIRDSKIVTSLIFVSNFALRSSFVETLVLSSFSGTIFYSASMFQE